MVNRTHRWISVLVFLGSCSVPTEYLKAQVFVVGERSATADIKTDLKPTNVPLSDEGLTERGRRELIRMLEAEQGFAHRALPLGPGLVLEANGQFKPGPEAYKKMIYEKGQAAAPGDRVAITAVVIKADSIVLDINGGPYARHRFLRHLQINDAPVAGDLYEVATGSRLTLHFEGGVPEISAPEVKALLEPVIDFRVKSGEQAYADSLPDQVKDSIAAHEVLVGMNHRMVLAALGAPESKLREQEATSTTTARYEEWIYGHVPETVRFIRFQGDRVTQVKVAAMGKPIEIHSQDELGGYTPPPPTHEIAMGDRTPDAPGDTASPPPSLRRDGEAAPANSPNKVLQPSTGRSSESANNAPIPASPQVPAAPQIH